MAVETAKVVRDTPSEDHGETIVSPKPEPSSVNSNVVAAAVTAPATIAPQLTAETDDSSDDKADAVEEGMVISATYRKKRARRIIMGIGTPNSQSRIPRPMMGLPC
jgi:hypothetical protein